jgi:5-methyltetrahydropteroyltriglutamate--homocysteine methyltransferase
MQAMISSVPRILTTVVGSYPVPEWLGNAPCAQALTDATAAVFKTQELAGIDVVADGELYRFDVNHPETNGMVEFFVRPLGGVRTAIGRADVDAFTRLHGMEFRSRPAAVVTGPVTEGTLDIVSACQRARRLTRSKLKFTVTGPHMLSRTLLDNHYRVPEDLSLAIAWALASQVAQLDADVVQVDEANITGRPEDAPWAVPAINHILESVRGERAMHLCFGNYAGQTIQRGHWSRLIAFINQLHLDHVLVEMAHRDPCEFEAFKGLKPEINVGLGVVDIKSTVVESADDIARQIERAEKIIGPGRIRYVNPDCGFWMLRRTIADRKMRALVQGRNRYLGIPG